MTNSSTWVHHKRIVELIQLQRLDETNIVISPRLRPEKSEELRRRIRNMVDEYDNP